MDAAPGITLSMERSGEIAVIRARGELDLATIQVLARVVMEACEETRLACVLDLDEVTFIDSEAIKSLLVLREELARKGVSLCIRKSSRQVSRVMVLLGIRDCFASSFCAEEPNQSI